MLSDQTPIPTPQSKEESGHKFRVEKVHGGRVVEEIETPEPMNDPECKHTWEIDPTETDFKAYRCTKDLCGIVVIFDK